MDIDVLGSYNTLKATLPYLKESAQKHRMDSKTREYSCLQLRGSADVRSVQPSPIGTGGRIIFVSATIHYRGQPFQTHVSVAKAGIDALSHSIALEYGPRGMTSNIIAPGPIANTEVSSRFYRTFSRNHPTNLLLRAWTVSCHQMPWRLIPRLSLSVASAMSAIFLMPLFICFRTLAATLPVKLLLVGFQPISP
jgi:NAD(P)-dependent dehydrogenase (short-subunit alcohol dehydrogenase family)